MPVYEYKCSDCGYKFDALRSIKESDNPLPCMKCSSQNTRRLLSTFFSHTGSDSSSSSSSGHSCSGCSGGSCASCGH